MLNGIKKKCQISSKSDRHEFLFFASEYWKRLLIFSLHKKIFDAYFGTPLLTHRQYYQVTNSLSWRCISHKIVEVLYCWTTYISVVDSLRYLSFWAWETLEIKSCKFEFNVWKELLLIFLKWSCTCGLQYSSNLQSGR